MREYVIIRIKSSLYLGVHLIDTDEKLGLLTGDWVLAAVPFLNEK